MLVPFGDVILLELFEDKEKKSTLVLPDSYEAERDTSAMFKIVAVGPGWWDSGVFIPTTAKKGDIVAVMSYGISKLVYEGKNVVISRERDIILKVEEKGGE